MSGGSSQLPTTAERAVIKSFFFFFFCILLIFVDWKLHTFFSQTNIVHINRQTRYIIYLHTHPTVPLNSILLLNNRSTAQRQREILYPSNCFYTCPISYYELLVYYLILRSLSQVVESS